MKEQLAFQKLLSKQLTEARLKNPSYSLRAFAKKAGLTPSALSEILNGKRRVSRELAQKVVHKLCVEPARAAELIRSFPDKLRRKGDGAAAPTREFTQLNMDHFRIISDWYHFAILSLSETDDYRHDPRWIGERLNIKSTDAAAALGRLERLGMLELDDQGKPVRGAPQYITSDDIADLSLRKVHGQNLELARASLEEDAVAERDFTAMTMAIDPDRLPEAKKMIREFRDRLCAFLESGRKKEVHKLCIQMIPLTKPRKPDTHQVSKEK
jgi:uncharacterized protein (TIGR02147 family)